MSFLQVDYLARAKRIEEIPQLLKQYEEEKQVNVEFWEQQERERVSCNFLSPRFVCGLCETSPFMAWCLKRVCMFSLFEG